MSAQVLDRVRLQEATQVVEAWEVAARRLQAAVDRCQGQAPASLAHRLDRARRQLQAAQVHQETALEGWHTASTARARQRMLRGK